jgi:hypothetical protein
MLSNFGNISKLMEFGARCEAGGLDFLNIDEVLI